MAVLHPGPCVFLAGRPRSSGERVPVSLVL